MNEITVVNQPLTKAEYKLQWQREFRRKFKEAHGFSSESNYSNGGKRLAVLRRDNFACCECGMTDSEHKSKWKRPITVDHIDKNRKNNTMENLRTLCLSCHGRKDLSWFLKLKTGPTHKKEIIEMRLNGMPYQKIADALDMGISTVWKWYKIWEKEGLCHTN